MIDSKKTLVSIIIVNYNTKTLVDDCLKSVFLLTEGIPFEVIVVDNASTESIRELIEDHYPQVSLIESKVNLGFGKANNLAAKVAKGEFLFLLNSDTVLLNNAVKLLVDFHLTNDNIGICGGNLYDRKMQPATSFSQLMPSVCSELDYLFFHAFSRLKYGKSLNFNYSGRPLAINGFISGADLMIRKEVFSQLNGFDPDFFMYYEETELTYRIKKLGLKIVSVPAAEILHLEGASESIKEASALRSFTSKFLYYDKTGLGNQKYFSHLCHMLTAIQRICLFKCLRKDYKVKMWAKLLELERKVYKLHQNS